MSLYSRLAPDPWLRDRNVSSIEALMRSFPSRDTSGNARLTTTSAKQSFVSRITIEEEKYERELVNVRTFGHHWLKPIGISKTMGQIEDEAREIQESFEEYEDEDNQFNQNNPEDITGLRGQDIMSEEGPEHEELEAPDLDENIEEGASFDAGETSYISGTSPAPRRSLREVESIAGRIDGATSELDDNSDGYEDEAEEGVSSAEEGSIGDYDTSEDASEVASE